MEANYGKHSTLTPEEKGRWHLYFSKPRFMRAQPGGPHPLCRMSHPGRRVNSKARQPDSRPHHWRNTAPSYYICFVKQAVLWNRGQHHTVILQKNGPPPRCSRFYAHMEARAVHSRPPHFLSSQPRPQPISLGEKQRQQPLIPPQHQAWPGNRRFKRQFAVDVPHVPASPNPSEASAVKFPDSPSPTLQTVDHLQRFYTPNIKIPFGDEDEVEDAPSAPPDLNQGHQEMVQDEAVTPSTLSTLSTPTTPSVTATPTTLGTPSIPATPTSSITPHSLSDFSRPASSQFSRSTDLNSSFSDALSVNLSDDDGADNGPIDEDNHAYDHNQNNEHTVGYISPTDPLFSAPESCGRTSSRMGFPQASLSESLTSCKQETPTFLLDTPIYTPKIQTQRPQSRQASDIQQFRDEILHSRSSLSQSGLSHESSNKSRQSHSSAGDSRSEWNLWRVLPPIMPQQDGLQGETVMEGTPDSKSIRSQSDLFAELDDLAPLSDPCVSPDHPAGSETDRSQSNTDLSPGLAALTVGCDSGDLGSLSRVHLLLLERGGSESPDIVLSPEWRNSPDGEDFKPGLRVWTSGIPQHYQSTVLESRKPLSGRNSDMCQAQDSLATMKGHRDCPELISNGSGSGTSSHVLLTQGSLRAASETKRDPYKVGSSQMKMI
ncbi:uncharacterized protein LOC130420952 isoform X2 [Triplophysa dalaica]|uniref:uncharacterized protein LOC130420952 isoform X2 n=1 Tax=Triplophysa dalaica TaxID=1582913 RepID=UPI0024DFF1E1|nr:uncharacterized protein LOC130420952 isoform X2 [Triplophysa dalaica]